MRKTREWCSSSCIGSSSNSDDDYNNNNVNNCNINNTNITNTNNNDITQQREKNEPSSGMEGLLCIGRPNPMRLSSSMCL